MSPAAQTAGSSTGQGVRGLVPEVILWNPAGLVVLKAFTTSFWQARLRADVCDIRREWGLSPAANNAWSQERLYLLALPPFKLHYLAHIAAFTDQKSPLRWQFDRCRIILTSKIMPRWALMDIDQSPSLSWPRGRTIQRLDFVCNVKLFCIVRVRTLLHWVITAQVLTTNQGTPVNNNSTSLTAGPRGPILLEDYALLEKMAQFDREMW